MFVGLSLGLRGQIGGSAAPTLRLAATHTRHHATSNLTNKQIMSRSAHDAVTAIDSLAIMVSGFTLSQSAAGETALGGSQTITASVEYPANTFTQITFGGNASGTVPDGGVLTSDYTTGSLGIPQGATFWIRMFRTSATGILFNSFRNSARGDLCTTAVSGLTDQTMGGTITQTSNTSACPQLIIAVSNAPAICVFGDSVPAGFGDTAESTTAAGPGLRGSIAKSLDGLAFHNIATGGLQATTWPSLTTGRAAFLPYFSHYIGDIGKNDCYVAIRSTAQIVTDVQAIYAQILAANPAARIIGCTQMHKSTSSDSWATSGGQTVLSRTATINGFNDIMRTSGLTGMNEGYFEIADQVATARNSGLWKNDGTTANLWTADGVHPRAFGYTQIANSGVVDTDAATAPSGAAPPPEPPAGPEAELVALLAAGGGQSSYHDFAQATNSGTWTSLDFSGLNNNMTQGTVSAQPAIGSTGATFDGGDCVNQTITGGTFTVLMQFTKADASTDGFMLSDQGNTGQVRYTSGGAAAVSGTSVNGSSVANSGALYTALHMTGVRIVKIESANFTGDTQLRIARAGTGATGLIRRVAVLDHTALGAGLAAAVAKAEEVMAL